MDDLKQTELLTEQTDPGAAKTQELPLVLLPAEDDDENFRAAQGRIMAMIAANAPLSEILSSLVLLIEAQSPEMLCSVLLLSDDGNHIFGMERRRVFPRITLERSTAVRSGRSMARAARLCSGASQS
jgi:hypothetical protein